MSLDNWEPVPGLVGIYTRRKDAPVLLSEEKQKRIDGILEDLQQKLDVIFEKRNA
jgi:hypothetical protein